MINLKVKTLDARTHEFTVDNEITVREFKDKILEKTNIPVTQQRIIYRGRVLGDDNQLKDLDVEGKVLHVAEQPPPQLREPSSPSSTAANGRSHVQGQVINPFAPSSSFCMNRITVARHMLECANNIAAYLEDPSRGLENAPLDILSRGRWTMESTVVEVGITEADMQQNNNILEMVQNAVQSALNRTANTLNNVSVMHLPSVLTDLPGSSSGTQSQPDDRNSTAETSASDTRNNAATSPSTPRININDVSNSSSETDTTTFVHPADTASSSSSTDNTAINNEDEANDNATAASGSTTNNGPRRTNTHVLADVIDQMHQVQARLEPFMSQYYEILRNHPAFDDADAQQNAQRIFDRVSEAMHYMAHAQHAISDLMLDMTLPTPRYLTCRPILVEQSGYVSANSFIPTLAQNLTRNGPRQSTAQQTLARGALVDEMRSPIFSHFDPVQIRNVYRSPSHFQRRRHSASSSGNNRRTGSNPQTLDFNFFQPNGMRGASQVAQPQQSQTPNNLNVVNRGNRTIITSTTNPNVFEYTNQNIPSSTPSTTATPTTTTAAATQNEMRTVLTPTTISPSAISSTLNNTIGNLINAFNNSVEANNGDVEVILPPLIVAVHEDGTHETLSMSSNGNNGDMQQMWGPVNFAPPDGDLRVHIDPPRVVPMFGTSTPVTVSTLNRGTSNHITTASVTYTNNTATQSTSEINSNRDNANNTGDTSATTPRRDVRFVAHGTNTRHPRAIPAVNANMIAFDRFLPCTSHHIDHIHGIQQDSTQASARIFTNANIGMRTAGTNTNARNTQMSHMPRITAASNYIPLLSEMRANNTTRVNQFQLNLPELNLSDTSGSSAENMGDESNIEENSGSSELPQTSQSNDGNNMRVDNLRDQLQNFMRIHFFDINGVNETTKSLAVEKATEEFTRFLIFLPQYELPEYDSRASVINVFRAMFPELLDLCFLEQAMPDFEVALRALTRKFCQRLFSVISVCVGGNVELPWSQLMRGLQQQIYLGLGLEAVDFICAYINSWLDWIVDANDIEQFLVKREPKSSQIMGETANVDSTKEQAAKNLSGETEPQPMETDEQEQESEKTNEELDWGSLGIDFEENASNNASAIEDDSVPEPVPVATGSKGWHKNVPNSWIPYLARDEKLQEDMAQNHAEDKQQQQQSQCSSSRRHLHQEPYSDAYIAGMLAKRRKLMHMTKPPTDVAGLISDCSRKAVVSLDANNATTSKTMQCADNIALQISQDPAVDAPLQQTIRATLRERLHGNDDFDEMRFPNTAKFLSETNQSHKSDISDNTPSTSSAVTASNVIPSSPAKKQDTVGEKTDNTDLSVDSQQKKTN